MIRKLFVWLFVALALGLSFSFYKELPSEIPSKFANLEGSPTAYASKNLMLFIIPFAMIINSLSLSTLSFMRKQGVTFKRLEKILDNIAITVNIVLLVLHCAIIYIGLGNEGNILLLLPIIVGIIFVVTGNLLPRIQVKDTHKNALKQASYGIWHQVSRTVSYSLFFWGLIMMFSILLPQNLILTSFFVILTLTVVSAFFFSYIRYTRYVKIN
ncbi:hypothetical protein CEW92_10485 [Bacillaceae bacterium SAS-127]|nr:hypothetical protein CEW92_10485 [Bacillaceae bacterium SAS-127]